MTATVKLPPELEHSLRQRCAAEGRSISDVMRDALLAYLNAAPATPPSAFSLGLDLFGRHAGPADLASQRRQLLADAWADKHRGH
ncbi:MAG: ribbon-helix-helix domain-containing protein [Lautropia sp.]|nr:ribbon-helix-helix domain-containing protein [Lautropia sp.]